MSKLSILYNNFQARTYGQVTEVQTERRLIVTVSVTSYTGIREKCDVAKLHWVSSTPTRVIEFNFIEVELRTE